MIHITTDCVFSGINGKYDELSIHDSKEIYGISKSLGEVDQVTIIRTSIIGEEIRNKYSLLEWIKSNKGKEINGYVNHFWNGVTCLELAKVIEYMIRNNYFWKGVRHIYSPEIVSKYELITMINEIYELDIKLHKCETEKCDRSLMSIYDILMFKIKPLREQIRELRYF